MADCSKIFPYELGPFYVANEEKLNARLAQCNDPAFYATKEKALCDGLIFPAAAKLKACRQQDEISKIKTAAPVIQQQIVAKVEKTKTLNYVLGGVAVVAILTAITVYSISD